jgi:hypothetical protein
MAAINFPTAPADNDTHSENGVNYRYSSSIGAWLVIAPSLMANTANHQIIFNYNDSTMGSNGLMFHRESNTFIVGNVLSRGNVTGTYYFGDGQFMTGMAVHIGPPFAQANIARNQANDAYTQANTSNLTAVGNTLSGVFTLRTNRNGLNFINGSQVNPINVDDWSATGRTNVTISVDVTSPFLQANTARDRANLAWVQANAAFDRANVANQYVVANTSAAGVMTLRSQLRSRMNFIPGGTLTINVDDDATADRVNVTITASGSAGFTANIGNGSANTFNIAHGLNKQFCLIQVREYENGGYYVYPDIRHMNPNDCIIQFVSPPSTNQYVVIVSGVA